MLLVEMEIMIITPVQTDQMVQAMVARVLMVVIQLQVRVVMVLLFSPIKQVQHKQQVDR